MDNGELLLIHVALTRNIVVKHSTLISQGYFYFHPINFLWIKFAGGEQNEKKSNVEATIPLITDICTAKTEQLIIYLRQVLQPRSLLQKNTIPTLNHATGLGQVKFVYEKKHMTSAIVMIRP
jgi:hypothetical protein